MKRTAKAAVLGALLQVGAHAAEQGAPATVSLDKEPQKVAAADQAISPGKKKGAARKKAGKATAAPKPVSGPKQDSLTETPPEEQSLQLKGVRG